MVVTLKSPLAGGLRVWVPNLTMVFANCDPSRAVSSAMGMGAARLQGCLVRSVWSQPFHHPTRVTVLHRHGPGQKVVEKGGFVKVTVPDSQSRELRAHLSLPVCCFHLLCWGGPGPAWLAPPVVALGGPCSVCSSRRGKGRTQLSLLPRALQRKRRHRPG